nr:hypothetical protein CFP56_05554 [Quercus suber]
MNPMTSTVVKNDPTLEDELGMFFDPQFEPQDWILFSPSHMQIQELGHLYVPNDLNSGKGGGDVPIWLE